MLVTKRNGVVTELDCEQGCSREEILKAAGVSPDELPYVVKPAAVKSNGNTAETVPGFTFGTVKSNGNTEPAAAQPKPTATKNARLDAALGYARAGVAVLQLCGKVPYPGTHGLKDATTDLETIRKWWKERPDANVGIPTGSTTKRFVLDVDPRHDGDASLAALEAQYGPLPNTRVSRTGTGGRHFVFKLLDGQAVKNSAGKLAPGLDIRGEGGYVAVPPSIHPETGVAYEWLSNAKPVTAPEWLYGLIKAAASNHTTPETVVPEGAIPDGQRNATLASIAGAMRRKGCTQDAIEAALLEENAKRCNPPMSESEVRAIAKSVSRYAPQEQSDPTKSYSTASPRPTGFVLQHIGELQNMGVLQGFTKAGFAPPPARR
jgi:putative DNA primase/helicase